MPSLIRLLVLHHDPSLYVTLRKLCATTADLLLVGEVTDVGRLPEQCRMTRPHILIVVGGLKPFVFDLASLLQEVAPSTKVFAILPSPDKIYASTLHTTRIAGCLFEHEISTGLIHLLRTVADGGSAFSGDFVRSLPSSMPDVYPQTASEPGHEAKAPVAQFHLTQREQEVLQLLAQGFTNKAIAQTLTVSEKTVEFHLKNLFEKLKVTSRTAAVLAAKAHHLVADH